VIDDPQDAPRPYNRRLWLAVAAFGAALFIAMLVAFYVLASRTHGSDMPGMDMGAAALAGTT